MTMGEREEGREGELREREREKEEKRESARECEKKRERQTDVKHSMPCPNDFVVECVAIIGQLRKTTQKNVFCHEKHIFGHVLFLPIFPFCAVDR